MEKTKRNQEIFNKKMGIGYPIHTYRELGKEYKLATETVFKIIKRLKTKKEIEELQAKVDKHEN